MAAHKQQNVSALLPACLLSRKTKFQSAEFDHSFRSNYLFLIDFGPSSTQHLDVLRMRNESKPAGRRQNREPYFSCSRPTV